MFVLCVCVFLSVLNQSVSEESVDLAGQEISDRSKTTRNCLYLLIGVLFLSSFVKGWGCFQNTPFSHSNFFAMLSALRFPKEKTQAKNSKTFKSSTQGKIRFFINIQTCKQNFQEGLRLGSNSKISKHVCFIT